MSWIKNSEHPVAKILVWIGDCPGHTEFCHNKGKEWDNHLDGLSDVPLMSDLIKQIKDEMNIFIVIRFYKLCSIDVTKH